MTTWTDPTETAAAALLTLIETARDDGTFDDQLAAINAGDTEVDFERSDIVVAERHLPLTKLAQLDDRIQVSLLPGPEGDEEPGGRGGLVDETFTVDLLIECKLPTEVSGAINPLIGLGRQVSRLCSHNGTARRRLAGIDAVWLKTETVAKYDPSTLFDKTVLIHLRRLTFELKS